MKNAQRKSRGVAFIQYATGDAANACTELNETEVIIEHHYV